MSSSQALLRLRPSVLVSLLLLMFLLHKSEGIRLDESFKQDANQKIHEEDSSLMEKNGNNGVAKEITSCKEGHCTGIVRKLATLTTSTSATASMKKEQNGGTKSNSKGGPTPNKHQQGMTHDEYVEIDQDITEMDYSPARRKPPIHN